MDGKNLVSWACRVPVWWTLRFKGHRVRIFSWGFGLYGLDQGVEADQAALI